MAMLYSVLLAAHIAGGIATGVAASYAGVVLWRRTQLSYRTCALVLGSLAAFEILSGTALFAFFRAISATALCANIALYLSAIIFVEALLYMRMKQAALSFPLAKILSPALASILFMAASVGFGF